MNPNEQTVRNMVAEWLEAFKNKDSATLVKHYTPDTTLYDCKPPYVLRGPDAVKELWEQCFPFFPSNFSVATHDLHFDVGTDMAMHNGLVRMVTDDPKFEACCSWMRVSVVYRKVGNDWKVVHEHVSIPFNPMTDTVAKITDVNDLMCGVDYSGAVPLDQQ